MGWFSKKKELVLPNMEKHFRQIYMDCIIKTNSYKQNVHTDIKYQKTINTEVLTMEKFQLLTRNIKDIEPFIIKHTNCDGYDEIGLDWDSFSYQDWFQGSTHYYRVIFSFGGLKFSRNYEEIKN